MKVIKNILNDKDFKKLQEVILKQTFPWYYNNAQSEENDNNFQFVHTFYWEDKILSPFWNYIAPILNTLKVKKIIRIKANLTTKKTEKIRSNMHIDTKIKESKTAVFYCNSNNGSTIFENGEVITSEENKIVIFDSDKMHCAASCTDTNIRIVINFNYLN
tara:strand:- start:597 stop:1076 length:480 start_codon:yes stop_codon:yes gene_type:complete